MEKAREERKKRGKGMEVEGKGGKARGKRREKGSEREENRKEKGRGRIKVWEGGEIKYTPETLSNQPV